MMDPPKFRSTVLLVAACALLAGCGRKLDPRIQEGYDLVVAGRIDDAIALTNSLLAEDPENAQARNVLGLAHYKAGRLEPAIEQYQFAIKADRGLAEAHFNLGNAYEMLGRMKEAEEAFAAAVREEKEFVLAHYNLGKIYERSGRIDQALAEYRRCVDYDRQYTLAYIDLGKILYESGDMDGAIANLSRALELEPGVKEVRVLLGNAYMRTTQEGSARLAENEYRAAVGIDPTYIDGLYSLGLSLATQGRHDEAIPWFERVLELKAGQEENVMTRTVREYFRQVGYTPTGPKEPSAG